MASREFLMAFFTQQMLQWASHSLRDYPWRHDRTAYRVFISEVFLQRTKADQVRPIYDQFLKKYPDYTSLYRMKKKDIGQYFAPLGLNKRAGIFWKAINQLKTHNKPIEQLTDTEFREIQGIGEYSFNAIRCFGENRRTPIVDSNVIRIFQRFFGYVSDKKTPRNDKKVWEFAAALLPSENYVEYNYALIDFGALICTPNKPKCIECNFQDECIFYSQKIGSDKI
jgi:A/G-specific adenine glycosylase